MKTVTEIFSSIVLNDSVMRERLLRDMFRMVSSEENFSHADNFFIAFKYFACYNQIDTQLTVNYWTAYKELLLPSW